MAGKKVGELIKEARTAAGLSQEKLAQAVDGVSASDISKAERGEKELPQAALKQIAKATGVTQKSLLEAASGTAKTSTASKKTSTASKKTSTTSKKTDSAEIKLTAAEKRVLELYRAADSDTKKGGGEAAQRRKGRKRAGDPVRQRRGAAGQSRKEVIRRGSDRGRRTGSYESDPGSDRL